MKLPEVKPLRPNLLRNVVQSDVLATSLVLDHDDGHVLSGVAAAEDRIDVVDCRQVFRHDRVLGLRAVLPGEVDTADDVVVRHEVVELGHADHRRRERRGHLRRAHIGEVAVGEHVDLGAEGLTHLAGGAGEVDGAAAFGHRMHAEAVAGEPGADRVDVALRKAEALAELLCGQPFVIVGRAAVLLLFHQLVQRLLLRVGAVEQQHHVVEPHVVGDAAAVVLGRRIGMDVRRERRQRVLVDRREDLRACRIGRSCESACRNQACGSHQAVT